MSGGGFDLQMDVGLNDFTRDLIRFKDLTGKTWPDILGKEGRLLAVSFARATAPFGFEANARASGENAILADLRKVYGDSGTVFASLKNSGEGDKAEAFYALFQARKYRKAEKVLRSAKSPLRGAEVGGKFSPSFHVGRRRASDGKTGGGSLPSVILADSGKRGLKAYTKQLLARVGWVKAAWAACAKHFGGTRGIPQWVTRHRNSKGAVVDKTRSKFDPFFVLRNLVSYAERTLPASKRAAALAIVRRNMSAEIQKRVEKSAKQSFR